MMHTKLLAEISQKILTQINESVCPSSFWSLTIRTFISNGNWLSMLKWIPTGKNKWLWNSFRILSLWSGRLLEKEAALMAMVAGHWLPMLKWIPTRKNRWLWNSFGILSLWSGRLLEKEAALMAMDAGHWLPMLWCEPTAAGAEVLQWYQVNAPVLLTFSF